MGTTTDLAPELARYLSTRAGGLVSVRSDGTTYLKGLLHDWTLYTRKRPDVSLDAWRAHKLERINALPAWTRNVDELPSLEELQAWSNDGVAESVTGERVEPDGYGPDGAPSWLIALRLI